MTILTVISDTMDDAAARRLRTTMCGHVAQGNIVHVFDMRELTALDSCTLAALIRALRIVREVGGSIRLVAGHPNVLGILSMTALDRVFGVYQNGSDAVSGSRRYASQQSMMR
jgi:anti-anti-sigma factor